MAGKYQLISVESDAKTVKGSRSGYLTGILYLAPATEANSAHNLCPMASEECRRACLYGAGMAGVFPSIKAARVAKTRLLLEDRSGFVAALTTDIHKLVAEARRRAMIPAIRINGTSDLPQLALEIAKMFPEVQFYDYTKIPRAWERTLVNYHLTFSHSGDNLTECLQALAHGINVAVVFAGKLPPSWRGFPVIDGDASDLRFIDPAGVIVGLKTKGDARKLEAGRFVQIGEAA